MARKRDLERQYAAAMNSWMLERKTSAELRGKQDRRDRTIATLYPQYANEWGVIDWGTLHATAEAVRRARQAKADAKTLKKWENN